MPTRCARRPFPTGIVTPPAAAVLVKPVSHPFSILRVVHQRIRRRATLPHYRADSDTVGGLADS
jgi:hypothetical protein